MDPFDKLFRDAADAARNAGPDFREHMIAAIRDAREIVEKGLEGTVRSGTLVDVLTMVVAVHRMAPKPAPFMPLPVMSHTFRPPVCPHFTNPRGVPETDPQGAPVTPVRASLEADCKAEGPRPTEESPHPCRFVALATTTFEDCIYYKLHYATLRDKGLGPDPIPLPPPAPTGL